MINMRYKTKRIMKNKLRKLLLFLKEIEPVLRLAEVIVVIWGVVSVSSRANQIAQMQLELDKSSTQPVFDITESILPNFNGEENANSRITISNLSGVCNNVRVSDACFMTLYYNEATVKEDIKLDDFYFINTIYGSTQGVICTMESEDNWKNYAALNLDVIKSPQINAGYLELHKYIRVIYEDVIGEAHTNYYKVDGSDITLLSQEEGKNSFEKYRKLEKGLYVEELTIENLIELIN